MLASLSQRSFFAASFATSCTASGRHVTLMGGDAARLAAAAWGSPVAAGATARMCVARRAVFILTCEREPGQGHREMSGAVKEIARLLSRPQTFCGLVAIALCFVHKPSPFTPRRVSGRSHLEWRLLIGGILRSAYRPGLYKIAHSRKIQNEALPGHRFRCPEEVQMQNEGFLTCVVPQCLA